MAESRVDRILARYQEMKSDKSVWLPIYDLIGQYVFTRKQHFASNVIQGEIQNANIFDDTAISANAYLAASLIGAMWPNGGKSFRITMPFGMQQEIEQLTMGQQGDTDEIRKYYEWVTKRMASYMDNPKCGFITALEEYMLDQGSFGISGISAEDQDDDEVPIMYRALDAKITCIGEGANGFVNTVYIERRYTPRQLVEKYGVDNISAEAKKAYNAGDNKLKIAVLQAVEPRLERDPYGFGVKNMPIASIHVEIKSKKILKESGYREMPLAVARFWKAMGETYARSPGMNALPSILEANALGQAWTVAVEKTLDPSLLVLEDSNMGNGIIDTSAGGLTVVSVSGRLGQHKPIEPLFIVGDLKWTAERRQELVTSIGNHFFSDRLTGLGKEERMQNPEVQIVNDLRGQSMNTVYSRQMAELFTPIIDRTFAVLYRKGLLGVIRGSKQDAALTARGVTPVYIPDAISERVKHGQDAYEIQFISPATRIMQAEELQGIEHTLQVAVNAGSVQPEALDNVNMDFALRRIQELSGAPSETINSMEAVVNLRKARAQQQAAVQKAEMDRQNSETARNVGQAVSSVAPPKPQQQGAAA